MKVYLVWEVTHSLHIPQQRLKGIFASEESAKKMVEQLSLTNNHPVETDDYGPYEGIEYCYYENEVMS